MQEHMGKFLKIANIIKSLREYYAIICFLDAILKSLYKNHCSIIIKFLWNCILCVHQCELTLAPMQLRWVPQSVRKVRQGRQTKDVGNQETQGDALKDDEASHLRKRSWEHCSSPEASLYDAVAMLLRPLPKHEVPGLARKE